MADQSSDRTSIGRRQMLTTLGASATATSLLATLGRASRTGFEADVRRARDRRANAGTNEAFVHYLTKRGYRVGSNTTVTVFPSRASDDPSTQKLEPDDANQLAATINLVAYHDNCNPDPWKLYVEYYWEWSVESGYGEKHRDSFGVGWPAGSFEYNEDSHTSSENVEYYTRSNSLNGVSFKYDDTRLSEGHYEHGYGGCYARVGEDGYSDDTTFAGKWVHTYQDLEVCGFSVSSGGDMAYNFCLTGKSDYGGETQLDYGEADHRWNNC